MENRIKISNLTGSLYIFTFEIFKIFDITFEKGLQILEIIDSNEESVSPTKRVMKKLLACYEEILHEKKNLTHQATLLEYMKPILYS